MSENISDQTAEARKKVRKLFLPAWYLPNGIKNANETELEGASESFERWTICSGALVIVAIIAEFVIAIIEPPYNLFLRLSILPDAGVAIGIVGEVLFAMWNNRIQTELRSRSNKKLGDAEKSAAEANQKAQEAALKLAMLTTPRTISPEQKAQIVEAIKPFAGTPFDLFLQPEPEPLALMNQVCEALIEAGWDWRSVPHLITFMRPGKPSVGMMTDEGVRILIASSKMAEWEQQIVALGTALIAAGLEGVAAQQADDGSADDKAIHVRIGRKP